MATRLYLINTATAPGLAADPLKRDLLRAIGTGTATLNTDTTAGGTLIPVGTGGSGILTGAITLTSERVAAQFTLTGAVTVNIWANEVISTINASLRAKLYKRTEGGSNIEQLVAEGDFPSELGTTMAVRSWTITPAASVVVGENERLVLRLYVIPAPSLTMAALADGVVMKFSSTAAALAESWVELTENVTFKNNFTKLYLRRTTVNGIGNFYDMLPDLGSSSFTTGVVNTAASGTDIQWTRTAGGTVLEWISPRLASGFLFVDPGGTQDAARLLAWMFESATAANCGPRFRMYRWRAGVEVEIGRLTAGVEFATSAALWTMYLGDAVDVTATGLLPDDRIVLRIFIANVGTMGGSRTCTVNYDHNVVDVNGNSLLQLLATPEFKAEGDPVEAHQSRLMMGGVGN